MNRVRCVSEDGINLIGFKYGGDNDEWNIIIPGVDGNIITNEFVTYMGEYLSENGQSFLLAHHRGSFQIISSNSLNPNIPGVTIGSVFEKFDDSIYDINAWIKLAIDSGAKRINLLGHSHGCNKIINYLFKVHEYDNYINKIILISPLDLRTRMNNRREIDKLYNKANEAKKSEELGNFICSGFFYKDSESFFDMMENPSIDNFPMMSEYKNDFSIFNSIKKDKYIVYGSDESKYTKLYDIKKKFLNEYVKSLAIIEGASHIYQGKEEELAKYVLSIIGK